MRKRHRRLHQPDGASHHRAFWALSHPQPSSGRSGAAASVPAGRHSAGPSRNNPRVSVAHASRIMASEFTAVTNDRRRPAPPRLRPLPRAAVLQRRGRQRRRPQCETRRGAEPQPDEGVKQQPRLPIHLTRGLIDASLVFCGDCDVRQRRNGRRAGPEGGRWADPARVGRVLRLSRTWQAANAAMRAEWDALPKFVYGRLDGRRLPYRGPVSKPVIWLRSAEAIEFDLKVEFSSGRPAVWWPATMEPAGGGPVWRQRQGAVTCAGRAILKQPKTRGGGGGPAATLQPVPEGHWMADLRKVEADDVFVWNEHAQIQQPAFQIERFLYYDGIMPPTDCVKLTVKGAGVSLHNRAEHAVEDVWVVDCRTAGKVLIGSADADAAGAEARRRARRRRGRRAERRETGAKPDRGSTRQGGAGGGRGQGRWRRGARTSWRPTG